MWVEAIIVKDDLAGLVGELCPLAIRLDQDGDVSITDPRDVSLVPDVGLRMTVSCDIHWPVLGMHVPVSIRGVTLEVRPHIVDGASGPSLSFKLQLDDVDVAAFPLFVDRGIVGLINKELAAKHVELSWAFAGTLSHVFELPEAMLSARALGLRVLAGKVKVTAEAVALAVSFEAHVPPRGQAAQQAVSSQVLAPLPPVAPAPCVPGHRPLGALAELLRRSPASVVAMCGAAFMTGMGVLALASGRRR